MSDHALLAISTVAEVLILLAVLYEAGTTIADRTRAKAAQRGAAAFRRRNPIIVILLIPLTSTVAWVTVSLYGDAAHAALAYTAFVLLLVLASASVVFAIRRFTHRIQEIGFHSTEAPYRREIPLPDKTPQAGFPVSDVRYSLGVRAGSAAVTLEVCLPDDGNALRSREVR